jgi:hypothetical protein
MACARISELDPDPHAATDFPDAAFENIAHPKITADLLHGRHLTLIREGGIASDDEEAPQPSQRSPRLSHQRGTLAPDRARPLLSKPKIMKTTAWNRRMPASVTRTPTRPFHEKIAMTANWFPEPSRAPAPSPSASALPEFLRHLVAPHPLRELDDRRAEAERPVMRVMYLLSSSRLAPAR